MLAEGMLFKLIGGVFTLTLCAMGSAVLPLAWAFSVTSATSATLMLLLVGAANVYTCDILLHAARITGTRDYESLAFAVGGRPLKAVTEFFVLLLLYGSMIGTFVQLSEISSYTLRSYWNSPPAWLLSHHGATLMLLLVLLLVLPLSLLPDMQSLEYIGMLGCALVVALLVVVVSNSLQAGLPALTSGQFPLTGIRDLGSACGASSVFGFAFYLQPFIMPLLSEMPAGRTGVVITSTAMRITLLGTCMSTYLLVGFFGAARYGADTQGDILQNRWLNGLTGFLMNVGMTVYLALSTPCIEVAMRHTITGWLPAPSTPQGALTDPLLPHTQTAEPQTSHNTNRFRHLVVALTVLGSASTIAACFPEDSAAILVITGAVGVCSVSYVIPITVHLALFCGVAKCQLEAAARKLPSSRSFRLHGCWNANNPIGRPLGRILRRLSSVADEDSSAQYQRQSASLQRHSSAPQEINIDRHSRHAQLAGPLGSPGDSEPHNGSLRRTLSMLLRAISWTATPPAMHAVQPSPAIAVNLDKLPGSKGLHEADHGPHTDPQISSPNAHLSEEQKDVLEENSSILQGHHPSANTEAGSTTNTQAGCAVSRVGEMNNDSAASWSPRTPGGQGTGALGPSRDSQQWGTTDLECINTVALYEPSEGRNEASPCSHHSWAVNDSAVGCHQGPVSEHRAPVPGAGAAVHVEGRWRVEDETYCLLEEPYCSRSNMMLTLCFDMLLPLLVAGVGCCASVAALADLADSNGLRRTWG